MNEELGKHGGREGKSEYALCGAECESIVNMLWECSAYSHLCGAASGAFRKQQILTSKTAYVLGSGSGNMTLTITQLSEGICCSYIDL